MPQPLPIPSIWLPIAVERCVPNIPFLPSPVALTNAIPTFAFLILLWLNVIFFSTMRAERFP